MNPRLRVAFQGELGAFSEEAIQQLWGGDVDLVPCREFRDVADAIASGSVDRAVLPIENTIVGPAIGKSSAASRVHSAGATRQNTWRAFVASALSTPVAPQSWRTGSCW